MTLRFGSNHKHGEWSAVTAFIEQSQLSYTPMFRHPGSESDSRSPSEIPNESTGLVSRTRLRIYESDSIYEAPVGSWMQLYAVVHTGRNQYMLVLQFTHYQGFGQQPLSTFIVCHYRNSIDTLNEVQRYLRFVVERNEDRRNEDL